MIRLYEDLTDLEKLSLIEISSSRLALFDRCQQAYFYHYILCEPTKWNAYAAMGSVIHSILEHTDFDAPLDVSKMLEQFDEFRAKHDPDLEITDELIEAGHEILHEFVDRHAGDVWHIEGREVPFAIVVGSALIVGYIDRVDKLADDYIHYIDYKSGKKEVAEKNVKDDFQLGIYALALAKQYPNAQIRGDLYYLRSGKMKGHLYTKADLARMEKRLIAAVNTIIDTENFQPTSNKFTCKYCDYNTICPVGIKRLS